jgi:23S rRNA C2498 (ribose-2'-O)-methylase RlmM
MNTIAERIRFAMNVRNVKQVEMEIFSFAYSSEKNCYVASDCQPVLCDEFVREIEKEVLYLRKVSR